MAFGSDIIHIATEIYVLAPPILVVYLYFMTREMIHKAGWKVSLLGHDVFIFVCGPFIQIQSR